MRKYQWIAAVAVFAAHSVAALGEVPTTPGSDIQQLTGGNGSDVDIRPGMRVMMHLEGLLGIKQHTSLRDAFNKDDALTGLRYRKLTNLSMVDFYPVANLHISYGFHSWKGKLPKAGFATPGSVGRLNLNEVAPLLPVRNTHANISPMMTVGYQRKLAKFTQLGFEAGMISDHGSNRGNILPGEVREKWHSTGAIAQVAFKTRFF